MGDRRRVPFDGQIALASLRGQVEASQFVEGVAASVAVPSAVLSATPDGGPAKMLLLGEPLTVISETASHAFVQSEWDSYCGYVACETLGPPIAATHRITATASHAYHAPDMKSGAVARLTFNSGLAVSKRVGRFLKMPLGWVPMQHAAPVSEAAPDPVAMAERFLSTPYLWGGNTATGLDCSGLVQMALWAAGMPCPRDSDMQFAELGHMLAADAASQRGDLVFWKGHVGIMADADRLLHANAHHMAVVIEPLAEAEARIRAAEFGPITGRKRLSF